MTVKSEKLKRFEVELADLEQWLKMGLVPKSDIDKHKTEITAVKKKINDEKKRLQSLKESGEIEEYVTPRKQAARASYTESPTLPDAGNTEAPTAMTEESETATPTETPTEEAETSEETISEEEDPFSDKARWKRGMLHGDDDEW